MLCSKPMLLCYPSHSTTYVSSIFLSAASSAPDISTECMADYLKVNACVEKAISEDSTLGDKIETTSATAHPCIEGAADDDAKEACLQPLKQLVHATCPSQFESMESSCCGHLLFRWSCASASFQFEGFALDLAEQLEDGESYIDVFFCLEVFVTVHNMVMLCLGASLSLCLISHRCF